VSLVCGAFKFLIYTLKNSGLQSGKVSGFKASAFRESRRFLQGCGRRPKKEIPQMLC
jgi:hypothetical protein